MLTQVIIKIPLNAKLTDIIEMLNFLKLTGNVESSDPEFHIWLNEHKEWVAKDG